MHTRKGGGIGKRPHEQTKKTKWEACEEVQNSKVLYARCPRLSMRGMRRCEANDAYYGGVKDSSYEPLDIYWERIKDKGVC
jgi:hypothetical protein